MGSKKKTTSRSTPWGPAEGAIKNSLASMTAGNANAQATYDQFRPAQNAAIQQIADRIATPPQYIQDARSQLDKTINGDFIGQNPHTSAIADLIAQKTGAQYNSTFGGAGRAHGGMAALLSGQGVGDALQSFYGNQYNQERGLQQQAIMAAPGFHQDENTDIAALFPAINNTAMGPLQAAALYGQGINGVSGQFGVNKTTEKTPFGLQQAIGLAMMAGGAATGNPAMMSGGAGMAGGGGSSGAAVPATFGNSGGGGLYGGVNGDFASFLG